MSSFDPQPERPAAEMTSATELSQHLPASATLDSHSQQPPLKRIADSRGNHGEHLAAIVLELQANRAVLEGLRRWYGLFVFTGGQVPTAQWNLAATHAYLEHPTASECLATAEIQRYQDLVQTIRELGHSGTGPTTLRYRYGLGGKFGQASSEIVGLTNALESSVTKAMEGLLSSSA